MCVIGVQTCAQSSQIWHVRQLRPPARTSIRNDAVNSRRMRLMNNPGLIAFPLFPSLRCTHFRSETSSRSDASCTPHPESSYVYPLLHKSVQTLSHACVLRLSQSGSPKLSLWPIASRNIAIAWTLLTGTYIAGRTSVEYAKTSRVRVLRYHSRSALISSASIAFPDANLLVLQTAQ